jgi:hypothetical protein
MPTTHSYPYAQFDSKNSLRLVHLLPATCHDDELRCRLTYSEIGGSSSYEALSYTWGNPNDVLPICLDNYAFNVTVNLHSALRRLRLTHEERILWIDAICINQADSIEKGWQVPRMQQIYSYADRVTVWLGENNNLTNLALDFVQKAATTERGTRRAELADRFNRKGRPEQTEEYKSVLIMDDEDCKSLDLLFEKPWWTRVWVVQEVASSVSCTILCGSREVNWNDFSDSYSLIFQTRQTSPFSGAHRTIRRMRIIPLVEQLRELVMNPFASSIFSKPDKVGIVFRKILSSSSNLNLTSRFVDPSREGELLRLLLGFRNLEATDARDRIYAGLSILYPYGTTGFFPILHLNHEDEVDGLWRADYEKQAGQLFARATQFICLSFKDLKFLSLVEPEIEEKDDPTNFTPLEEIPNQTLVDIANIRWINGQNLRVRTSPNQRSELDDANYLQDIDGFKREVIPQLPSWSPNWAQGRLSHPIPGDYEMDQGRPYQASGSLEMSARFHQRESGFVEELITKAVHVGTVSITGRDFYQRGFVANVKNAAEVMLDADSLIGSPSSKEALIRTIVGDRNADSTQITGEETADPEKILLRAAQFTRGKRFIVAGGLIGFGPRAANMGDDVYIIPGCHVPVIIRKKTLYMMEHKCSVHSSTDHCVRHGCGMSSVRHDLDSWYQVIGGACKISTSQFRSGRNCELKNTRYSWNYEW